MNLLNLLECLQEGSFCVVMPSLHCEAEIQRLVTDSRQVASGDAFVVYENGFPFMESAVTNGAAALIISQKTHQDNFLKSFGVPVVVLDDFPAQLPLLCNCLYGNTSHSLKVIGITGTNGKTTTAWMVHQMLEATGKSSCYIGTLGFKTSQTPLKELANTTPYVVELHNLLKQAHDEGCEYASIEVSSHALDQNRVGGISFDVGAFTNLSQDHLDYHGTMEAYENAKWRLFSEFQPRMAVFNVDDEVGLRWAQNFKGESVTFGTRGRLTGMVSQITASSLDLKIQDSCDPLSVPMSFNLRVGGLFNYYNFLGASSILLALGFNLEQVRNASEGVSPVAGRFQGIANNLGASVIVDYAHTPDGLQKVLESAREVTSGKLIVIFGCGGDRDKSKRPLMGNIASKLADAVILTSDNPRTEDPLTILEEVASGLHPLTQQIQIVDRVEAINYGVSMLNSGDTLVIAGKGHENYQIVGKEKVHLDDSKIAHEALSLRTR